MIKDEFGQRILRLDNFCGQIKWDEVMLDHAAYCWCEKMGGKPTIYGFCSEAEGPTKEEWNTWREENGFSPIDDKKSFIDDPLNDPINDPINDPLKPTKKQKKRVRDKKHKEKQSRIYNALSNWYPTPMWPRYKNDEWWRDEGERGKILYFRTSHHNRYKQWLKKQSNKKIRRTKGVPKRGKGFKKIFDLWWELW